MIRLFGSRAKNSAAKLIAEGSVVGAYRLDGLTAFYIKTPSDRTNETTEVDFFDEVNPEDYLGRDVRFFEKTRWKGKSRVFYQHIEIRPEEGKSSGDFAIASFSKRTALLEKNRLT
tara:strand:- start:870 stop:1217 length:348 start_codon:yes stop_codon:yes gene_type:complete